MAPGSRVITPLAAPTREPSRRRLPLVDRYLREQRELTAVERFARAHDDPAHAPRGDRYEALLPATPPSTGEQYAFKVDLDACTGCKACVTACHNLNGLDDGETWRAVGLLHGGSAAAPVKQWVTTACHHCVEPACMKGCPVGAYEKDALTGIVRHLDDQCIGCQYCTFTCPYDVPQYDVTRGIVRKCDMCTDRLAEGEAPACVQGCPNDAIAITVVSRRQAIEDAQGDAFVPGAPSPAITIPTTVYATSRALPRNLLPADFYAVRPAHRHAPLVLMLVLTQLSVGALCVEPIARRALPEAVTRAHAPLHATVAVAVGLAALGASVLHLGRPRYAFRALLGLRTSWMSREILAFGLFAPLAVAYAASLRVPGLVPASGALLALTAIAGLIGIVCSTLIYHVTRRPFWSAPSTALRFFGTAALLGLATALVTSSATLPLDDAAARAALDAWGAALARALVMASVAKGAGELAALRHLASAQHSERKRSAILLTGDLARYTTARFVMLVAGGVVAPLVLLRAGASPLGATIALALLVTGELLERTLFFAAASARGMPGGPR